ncbi:MAG TPA: sigma-70 family RNA polymerase sigma factor [Parcubacteria group bacterium]|nr:sigma-70 family RNA polymerase sigma factor [Parcubacteria group bacterium]
MQKARPAKRGRNNPEFHDEDNRLVARYLSGEEKAFELLYKKYRTKLLRFIKDSIGDWEKSEDIVQETFIRVWRHLHRYDASRKFSTWIYTIASNLCRNELRNRSRNIVTIFRKITEDETEDRWIEFEDPRQDPEIAIREREAKIVLATCLKQIPERRRRIFVLRRLEGHTIAETAKIMMCPRGTVKSGVSRTEDEIVELSRELIRREHT